ncbi:MAG: tyrosine-type recombinase/integrase, partial [Chloroflexi bacterium]|nr:tyrosine-type recombinase/integrase [Chloroflexota bacterium]
VADLIHEFMDAHLGILSPETTRWYRKRMEPLSGLGPVAQVSIRDLRRLRADLVRRGLSPYTVHGYVRAWKRLFRWAVQEGYIADSPAERLRLPPLPDEPPKAISDDDLLRMLECARSSPRLYALLLFLADTGVRLGGLAGLRVGDLDMAKRRAVVREKGRGGKRRARFVFFSPITAEALKTWLPMREPGDERVFQLSPMQIYDRLRSLAKRAGVRGRWNPHAFRHRFARVFLENGGDLARLSRLLGHTDVTVTAAFYARFLVDELQQAHDQYITMPKLD